MEDEIKVSICCTVYNHEKYLRKCLDGFVMQKTNFAYEVLIHDDASTDHSADIIREYEQKYPNIIKPIYQTENQYSKGVRISWVYQYPRARGKYIALCEGDDYWCDENKLQVQFDAMEAHPEVVFCAHKVRIIAETGEDTRRCCPAKRIEESIYDGDGIMRLMVEHDAYPFQTSSFFFKAEFVKNLKDSAPRFMIAANIGDVPLILFYATLGSFLYIEKEFSCYRWGSIGSWNIKNNIAGNRAKQIEQEIAFWLLFDAYSSDKFSDNIGHVIEKHLFRIYQLKNDIQGLRQSKLRWIFAQLPFKQRMYYNICGFFPGFEGFYKYLKSVGRRKSEKSKKD